MEFTERVKSMTQDALLPKVVDNVLSSNILPLRLMGNAKEGKGYNIKKTIKYQSSGVAVSFSGLDTFSAAQLNTKIRMEFDMRGVRIPVALSGMEVTANQVSETQVTDMVKEALEESEQELTDEIGDQLYGDGTGNSNKDFIGLGAIVDDGTDVATFGGLLRSSYDVLDAVRTASGGTMTLNKLATQFSGVSSGSINSSPTLLISDETVWDLYETLLTPMVRENYQMFGTYSVGKQGGVSRPKGLVGTQGFVALTYKGIPWVRDEKATAQTVFMLNEKHLEYRGWEAAPVLNYKKISLGSDTIEGLYAEAPMSDSHGFNWTGFRTPTNQFAIVADVIVLGNLACWSPSRQGRLTGVTGV